MSRLGRLELKFGKYALENLTEYLVAGQVLMWLLYFTERIERGTGLLIVSRALQGEPWRFVSFLFEPPATSPLWILFAWYIFLMMGRALEAEWGAFRYNLFVAVGFLFTLGSGFLVPDMPVTNTFLAGSVFLAFACLYPDYELMIFFILPVKVKWLALFAGAGYLIQLAFGNTTTRLMVLAALANFLLFFWRELLALVRRTGRQTRRMGARVVSQDQPTRHRCTVCGITEKTHPQEDFRYCAQCDGQQGYCEAHIRDHVHVTLAVKK